MIFDVMVREGFTENAKMIVNVYRIHDKRLSDYLRSMQDSGNYVLAVIPLFKKRETKTLVSNTEFDSDTLP